MSQLLCSICKNKIQLRPGERLTFSEGAHGFAVHTSCKETEAQQAEYDRWDSWIWQADTLSRETTGRSVYAIAEDVQLFTWWREGIEPDEAVGLAIRQKAEEEAALSYEVWMDAVIKFTFDTAGRSAMSLPDVDFMDMYQSGMDPVRASNEALHDSYYFLQGTGRR